jgi:hypothetical protein
MSEPVESCLEPIAFLAHLCQPLLDLSAEFLDHHRRQRSWPPHTAQTGSRGIGAA